MDTANGQTKKQKKDKKAKKAQAPAALPAITMDHVIAAIRASSDQAAIALLQEAATARLAELTKVERPQIGTGMKVRIVDIRPVVLKGLTGTVQQPNRTRSRWTVLLDEESTQRLRYHPNNTRWNIPASTTRFLLPGTGVPVGCLQPLEGEQ
ncbi:hypothetical protein [Streptomyces hydrogenans]|uniref:hypothetical protein n=1 Tax=Streptomyces hydrogenans TaxID=1873719 RepID=UPI0037F49045